MHSSDLVSYTISDRPVLSMVTTMLDKAFAKIPDGTNLILHSDQRWQYQHKQYQRMLQEKGIRQSMSRKGNCLDNAVIENFRKLQNKKSPIKPQGQQVRLTLG
ncbi:DDE-type integrase/transposase/recombinase [Butyricicoccus sp. AF18-9LB]|uniref:DDE-type integrase/transposase/recombinase n=1 Tax=Butyricicoccus sp. AF18-9LB TaxID=3002521 RepID=UPI0022E3B818|nr:DDE-type integrase/transposase/recombinase [Butyricicoccus sp. AF18-9LB]